MGDGRQQHVIYWIATTADSLYPLLTTIDQSGSSGLQHGLTCISINVHAVAAPVRSAKQIEGLRKACRVAREILDKAHAAVKPGVITDEIDRVVS